jgi:hypothetical protein
LDIAVAGTGFQGREGLAMACLVVICVFFAAAGLAAALALAAVVDSLIVKVRRRS